MARPHVVNSLRAAALGAGKAAGCPRSGSASPVCRDEEHGLGAGPELQGEGGCPLLSALHLPLHRRPGPSVAGQPLVPGAVGRPGTCRQREAGPLHPPVGCELPLGAPWVKADPPEGGP